MHNTNKQAYIFDLGGVLLNLAPERTRDAFVNLGVAHFDELFTIFKATPLFDLLETGHVSPGDFVDRMKKEMPGDTPDQLVIDAWNAMLLDFRLPSLRFVEQLNNRYPVFLYSNTNLIHYRYFQQSIQQETPYARLDQLFRKAYYSHDIGYRKPNADGYLHIIMEQGLEPGETLFIDDNQKNIEGAMAVGLQTHLLQPSERVEEVLASLLM